MIDYDVQDMLAKLTGSDRFAQQKALEFISQSNDVRFVDGLIDLVQETDSTLQRDCVSLLGHLGDNRAV